MEAAVMETLVSQEPAMAIATTPRSLRGIGKIANDQSWHTVLALLPEVEPGVPENPISQTLL
jgi:hypothetical protein